jgi:DNA-binding transcriptional LysR family regulator
LHFHHPYSENHCLLGNKDNVLNMRNKDLLLKNNVLYFRTINMGKLEDMALFVSIIESGSITATANRMRLAKSAVSRRLTELESNLGVQLLTRTTRRSSLTDAGLLYYQQAQRILSDTDEMINAVSAASDTLSGKLRIAVPLSFGLKHLSPVVSRFAKTHPKVIIDLDFSDGQMDLVTEGYDMAIRIANLTSSTLIARRFSTIRHCLCASPEYLTAHGTPQSPDDLNSHRVLRYKSASGQTHTLADEAGKIIDLKGEPALMSNNGDFLRQAALDGLGLYYAPTFIAWQDLRMGKLIPIMGDYKTIDLGAYAVYPQTKFVSGRVRQFIDHLAVHFGDVPYWDNWREG